MWVLQKDYRMVGTTGPGSEARRAWFVRGFAHCLEVNDLR